MLVGLLRFTNHGHLMPGEQDYLARLLRKLEASLTNTRDAPILSVVEKTIREIASASDVRDSLEQLYSVRGFDQFALRLMWLWEQASKGLVDEGNMEHEVETLGTLLNLVVVEVEPSPPPPDPPATLDGKAYDGFYEAIRKFGRTIEEFKKKSFDQENFKGIQQDLLGRILDQTAALQQTAAALGKEDIVRLAIVITNFIHYVIERALLKDVRIVNILDNTNLSLQGACDSTEPESLDALQQTVEMLQNPKNLLD
jgi:hypothetical protein